MSAKDAQMMANSKNLDLVKISPNANPPVCKIMDYGKYKYEQARKEKESKKKQKVVTVKEVRLRPGIEKVGVEELDHEGRLICLEYEDFYLLTCYTPNAQDGLKRLDFRMAWEDAFRSYLKTLDQNKPVIVCGDLNVAHNEIDLKNPKSNRGSAGFSDEERGKFTELLASGFTDTFRHLYPDQKDAYSWWSYRFNARKNNTGWRIDYFLTSDRLKDRISAAEIHNTVFGSDHCPVSLELSMEE